jgi:hypothetical protein
LLTLGFSHLESVRVRGQYFDTYWHSDGSFTDKTLGRPKLVFAEVRYIDWLSGGFALETELT